MAREGLNPEGEPFPAGERPRYTGLFAVRTRQTGGQIPHGESRTSLEPNRDRAAGDQLSPETADR